MVMISFVLLLGLEYVICDKCKGRVPVSLQSNLSLELITKLHKQNTVIGVYRSREVIIIMYDLIPLNFDMITSQLQHYSQIITMFIVIVTVFCPCYSNICYFLVC